MGIESTTSRVHSHTLRHDWPRCLIYNITLRNHEHVAALSSYVNINCQLMHSAFIAGGSERPPHDFIPNVNVHYLNILCGVCVSIYCPAKLLIPRNTVVNGWIILYSHPLYFSLSVIERLPVYSIVLFALVPNYLLDVMITPNKCLWS